MRRPSTIASHGLPYSLIRPSVDQVSEYFRTLFGCWGRAPTRSLTVRSSSKWPISSLAAIEMKPGREAALRHERLRRAFGDRAHGARDLDVFGQVEVVHAGAPRRLGDADVAVVGQARDHRVARDALAACASSAAASAASTPMRVQVRQAVCALTTALRRLAAHVGEMDLVGAGLGQQAGDQRADLAGAENENLDACGTSRENGWRILAHSGTRKPPPRYALFLQCSRIRVRWPEL